ncbi:MAG: phenylalanine--tRNA ligase subunit alpha, partial [Halobacteria archaeon]|nr:phenylalanine--tRNA ligase subunit alpha [Halobacteria archaeon]
MQQELNQLVTEAEQAITVADDLQTLDQVRVDFLGKKGHLTERMKALGKLSAEERPKAGQAINQAKQAVQQAIEMRREALKRAVLEAKLVGEKVDITLPGRHTPPGSLHPVT